MLTIEFVEDMVDLFISYDVFFFNLYETGYLYVNKNIVCT